MKANPQRMCTACRTLKEKAELVRIVISEGNVSIDETGRMNGRGAYICKTGQCIQKAKKTNSLSKAFKRKVDDSIYADLVRLYGQD